VTPSTVNKFAMTVRSKTPIDQLGLVALAAHTGYIVPLISMLLVKSEINEKVDNVTCWEYTQ